MTTSLTRTRRRVAGTLTALALAATGLAVTATDARASFPSASNGRIFFDGLVGSGAANQIWSMNPDGSDQQQLTTGSSNIGPDVSADGQHVVFGSDRTGHYQVWEMNPDGSDPVQVTHDDGDDWYPSFSPDGTQIAYRMTTADNVGDIYVANLDGSSTPTRLTTAPGLDSVAEWAAGPDGGTILFHSSRDDADPTGCSPCTQALYTMHADGSDQTPIVSVPGGRARFGNWSPDGSSIVYEHDSSLDPSSTNEIWTANADGSNQQLFAPTRGAINDEAPDWSPDGTQLVWTANGDLREAPVDGSGPVRDIDTGGLIVGSIDWSVTAATVLTSRTTLTVTPTSAAYGQPVTLKATVAPAGGVATAATGTVTFAVNGTAVGAPVALKKGVATGTFTTSTLGTNVVTATYSGDAAHSPSTARYTLTVDNALSTVTPSVGDGGELTYGQPLTATVTVQAPSRAKVPSGATGYAYVDGTLYDALPVRNGRLTVPQAALGAGGHSVEICVNTTSYLSGSCSGFETVTVDPVTATVTVSSSANPAGAGQRVTLTASVAPTATGQVDFYDGDAYLGTAQLAKGKARLRTSFPDPGMHPLTAQYGGDGNYSPATSAEYDQQVD